MSIAVFRWAACGGAALALLLAPVLAPATPPSQDQLSQLTTALAPELKDIKIDAPAADLAAGKPVTAQLSLPPALLASVQTEAGKLGLSRAARRVSVTATLSGEGYAVTPNGEQTAALASDQPVTFQWQVTPSGAGHTPLTAQLTGVLNGGAAPATFPLAEVSLDVAPAPPASAAPAPAPSGFTLERLTQLSRSAMKKVKASGFGALDIDALQIPGHKTVDIPGLGEVPSQKVVTAAILFLIVLILWGIARNAAERRARAERRRRFRTFEATNFGDEP
jgi:hypothetical protein